MDGHVPIPHPDCRSHRTGRLTTADYRLTALGGSTARRARQLGRVGRDGIHQRWRQAVVGLETQLSQPVPDSVLLIGAGARFDDRGREGGKLGRRPAVVPGEFRVDEIEPIEGQSIRVCSQGKSTQSISRQLRVRRAARPSGPSVIRSVSRALAGGRQPAMTRRSSMARPQT